MKESLPMTMLIVMMALIGLLTTENAVAQGWYNMSWQYRRAVSISNPGGTALTNYQVRINLGSSFNFSGAKNDGSDVRLTASDGTTLLSHWIEEWNAAGSQATIWVKVPAIPEGGTTLYLYSGNPNAAGSGNGYTTFEFFDHFSDTSDTAEVPPRGVYGNWQRVVIDNNLNGSHNVMVEDVDGDGKPDIVADAYVAETAVWYKQPTDPVHNAWTRYTIDPHLANAHDFQIGDIDGDGRRDLVGLSLSSYWGDYGQEPGYLCWYKKPVDPTAAGSTGWTSKAPLPYRQGDGSAAIYNNEIYVFGGHYLGVSDPRREAYKYNPPTDTWTRLTDMPTARWGPIAVECLGKIHVFSGEPTTSLHEVYDPVTNAWQSRALGNPLNIPQYAASGAVHPDVIYFPAGKDGYKYWMVYTPYPPASEENPSVLRSNDGVSWTDVGITNPVVPQGQSGEWNVGENADPDFMYVADYNKWFMVWAGQDSRGSEGIALAYSTNGRTWTQYNGATVNGNAHPVILSGEDTHGQSWERNSSGISLLQCPTLFYQGGTFYLYYVDEVEGNNSGNAGFATFTWNNSTSSVENLQRYAGNPTITTPCGHINLSRDPVSGLYQMHMVRGSSLALMTSSDMISWSDSGDVLESGESGQWDGGGIYRSCPVVDSSGTTVSYGGKTRIYYSASGSTPYRIGIADVSPTGPPVRFQGEGLADMPSGIGQGLMGIKYGDKIHLFYSSYHYEYNPIADTYTPKAAVPTGRTWATCALVDGKIYLIGGYPTCGTNEVYDPLTDTWTTKAPMPMDKYGVTRENPVINGKIYVTHGLDGGFHTDNFVYDVASDTWEQKSSGIHPRDGVLAAVVNNKLYVIAGRDDYINGGTGTNYVEEYDPARDSSSGGWQKTIIRASGSEGLLGARSCGLGDIDSDGDLDIAVAVDASPGKLFWYQNPGGSDASDSSLWHEYLIDATQARGADAQIGDLDQDGNPDIVYSDVPTAVYAYFAPADPTNIAGWQRVMIAGDAYHALLVDFDGDGDLDILRAGAYSALVSWIENPGGAAARNPANWHEYVIEQNASISIANRVWAADIDGDGDLDIGMDADPSGSTGTFKWYRRPADPKNVAAWQVYVIDDNPAYTAYAHDSHFGDIDMDGDIDVVGVGPNSKTVMWWINDTTYMDTSHTGPLDPMRWSSAGSPDVNNSIVTIAASGQYIRSQATFQYKAFRSKAKFESYANWGYLGFNSAPNLAVGANDATFICLNTPSVRSITSYSPSGPHNFTWGYEQNEGTDWKIWEVLWRENEAKFVVSDNLRYTHTTNVPAVSLNVQFNDAGSGNATVKVDWVLLRNYSPPEPTANLVPSQYSITISAVNGSVTKNPNQALYDSNATVQLTAIPATGYHFVNWGGDAGGSTNPLNVTMNANKSITANFAINQYSITITAVNGTVTKSPNQALYDSNTVVQLTVMPTTGYRFDTWSGDTSGSATPLYVTMDANKNITANFLSINDTITYDAIAGWNLISLPLQQVNMSPLGVFGDDYQSTSYYVFQYTPGTGYSIPTVLAMGQGYWLASNSPQTIDVKGMPISNLTCVLAAGFNIIGNPFAADEPKDSIQFTYGSESRNWPDAVTAGWLSNALLMYNGSGYAYAGTALIAWKGYWIPMLMNGVTIHYKAQMGGILPKQRTPSEEPISGTNWNLNLNANFVTPEGKTHTDAVAGFGVKADATGGFDSRYDVPRPPRSPAEDYVEVVFPVSGEQYPAALGKDYARLYVGSGEKAEWEFEVKTSQEGQVTLSWDKTKIKDLPGDVRIEMYDPGNHQKIDMKEVGKYSYEQHGTSHRFDINKAVGGPGRVGKATRYDLVQNYPNPFNPQTVIEYQIPERVHVTLEVYNILGEKVATLVSETQESGYYTVTWDGRDEGNRSLTSGIYICRITAGEFTKVVKMLPLK